MVQTTLICANYCAKLCANIFAEGLEVATNIDIDKVLIEEAMKVGGHTTKRAVVIEALQEYIQKRNQLDIIEMFDTVPYEKDYDYKKQRNRG